MVLWIALLALIVAIGLAATTVRRNGYSTSGVFLVALAWVLLGFLLFVWLM